VCDTIPYQFPGLQNIRMVAVTVSQTSKEKRSNRFVCCFLSCPCPHTYRTRLVELYFVLADGIDHHYVIDVSCWCRGTFSPLQCKQWAFHFLVQYIRPRNSICSALRKSRNVSRQRGHRLFSSMFATTATLLLQRKASEVPG